MLCQAVRRSTTKPILAAILPDSEPEAMELLDAVCGAGANAVYTALPVSARYGIVDFDVPAFAGSRPGPGFACQPLEFRASGNGSHAADDGGPRGGWNCAGSGKCASAGGSSTPSAARTCLLGRRRSALRRPHAWRR